MYSKLAFSITAILETDIMLIDEVLSVGDIVSCYVIDIKKETEKVSLSLIDPNNQKDSRN